MNAHSKLVNFSLMPTEQQQDVRRRRAPAEARQEILDGAVRFLRTHEWRELTIGNVMAQTTLSRPSFYLHFDDRVDLLTQLARSITGELKDRQDRLDFLNGDPGVGGSGAPVMEGLVSFYAKNASVMKALMAAAYHEPVIASETTAIQKQFIATNAVWIKREMTLGRAPEGDPQLIASALSLMTTNALVRWMDSRSNPGLDEITETLLRIWTGAIWCTTVDEARNRIAAGPSR
jgi:AcrR family transcriptional regulator